MIPQTYQSADNITFHGRKKWLLTDSNKFVPSWCNTCHIIIGCALLCTYVVIYALHKHHGPKENGWSNRNRSHMYNFLQGVTTASAARAWTSRSRWSARPARWQDMWSRELSDTQSLIILIFNVMLLMKYLPLTLFLELV